MERNGRQVSRSTVLSNIDIIIDQNLTWEEAIRQFQITDINLQKVYLRYIIVEYGYLKALYLLESKGFYQNPAKV